MKVHISLYIVCGICCFLFLFFPSFLYNNHFSYVVTPKKNDANLSTAPKFSKNETKIEKTGISFTGDIMLARNVENLMNTYGHFYPFGALTQHSDNLYLVGNFESAIPKIHVHTPSMGFSFSTKKEFLKGLQEYGFTHVGIANNHSYDFGSDDYKNAKAILEEVGLLPFGDQREQASSTIQFVKIADETLALVGIFAVDTAPTMHEIQSLLQRARNESSIQIAYVHFGTEYKTVHSSFQEDVAKNLIDAGADVVIGHHPHVVQDVQVYRNKLIFYSLGNFIFDQYFSKEVQEGLMVEMKVEEERLTFELLPITSIGSRSVPRFMERYEKDTFLIDLAKKSDAGLAVMITSGQISIPK